MRYEIAEDIKNEIKILVSKLKLNYIDPKRIFCIRSFDAKTKAVARIWGMSRLFKEVAGIKPCYIIEVNSRRFDKLPQHKKIKTLIHELLHIPKTFSGALLPHRTKNFKISERRINILAEKIKKT